MSALPALTWAALNCTPVSVPLAQPVRTASGNVTHASLALIDLVTEQGTIGRSYLFAYAPWALQPLVALVKGLGELLAGHPIAPAEIERTLQARLRLLGCTGLAAMAVAGIDMAAWDALARAAGLPLARLLGGRPRAVPGYDSQGMDGAERGGELAQRAVEQGFAMMKIKIGYPTLDEDLAVVRHVQSVLGPHCALAVDYNQSLSVPEALRRCAALDPLGLAWIEEPTLADDDDGHARIAACMHTPLQLGENWFGTHAMARSLRQQACDLVMPDAMKIGGVSGWLRAASLAGAAMRPMSSHLFPEYSTHLMAVTPTAHWLEVLDLAAPVLAAPLQVEGGCVHPADAPGSGVDWNDAAVERYRVL